MARAVKIKCVHCHKVFSYHICDKGDVKKIYCDKLACKRKQSFIVYHDRPAYVRYRQELERIRLSFLSRKRELSDTVFKEKNGHIFLGGIDKGKIVGETDKLFFVQRDGQGSVVPYRKTSTTK